MRDTLLHCAGEQAATGDARLAMIVFGAVIMLVHLAPQRRCAAGAAQMNRLALRVEPHLAPIAIKDRADAAAQVARDDPTMLRMLLITHDIPHCMNCDTTVCLCFFYCTAVGAEKMLVKGNESCHSRR